MMLVLCPPATAIGNCSHGCAAQCKHHSARVTLINLFLWTAHKVRLKRIIYIWYIHQAHLLSYKKKYATAHNVSKTERKRESENDVKRGTGNHLLYHIAYFYCAVCVYACMQLQCVVQFQQTDDVPASIRYSWYSDVPRYIPHSTYIVLTSICAKRNVFSFRINQQNKQTVWKKKMVTRNVCECV